MQIRTRLQFTQRMIINDLDGYYIVFDTKNWNTELDTLAIKIAKDAQIQAMKVMEKFGLTAKDRTKIAKLSDNSKELSPLEQFVKDSKEIR